MYDLGKGTLQQKVHFRKRYALGKGTLQEKVHFRKRCTLGKGTLQEKVHFRKRYYLGKEILQENSFYVGVDKLTLVFLFITFQVTCRIIYINSSLKKAGLSLQQPIVKGKAHEFGSYGVGDIIDTATVTRIDQGLGLLMTLSQDVMGYVHVRVLLCYCDRLDQPK